MSFKKHKRYPYSIEDPVNVGQPRRSDKKKRRIGRYIVLPVIGLLLLCVAGYLFVSLKAKGDGTSFHSFPKHLVAMRFQHNGKEVLLTPDSQVIVNPRDSLHLLEVKTDGWLSWGTKVVGNDLDLRTIREKPVVISDLLPHETFETPKSIEIRVLSGQNLLGKVSFLVQLDSKDWLQKANTTNELDRKIEYLEKAMQENSGNVLVKTQLAGLYFESKKYAEAAKLYKEIDESGKSKSVLERLLSIYQLQNRVDEALAVYLDLMKLSEDPECFKEFLHYLQKHKAKDDALKFLEKNQQAIPKTFQSSLLLVMADLSTQLKNWSKAASSYEKVIKAGVKDPDVLYNLAVSYQHGDDPDRAISALERYLQKNPGDMKSRMQLGELQEKKGDIPQARKTYETLLQKNPQNKDALVRLLALLEKSNDKAGLLSTYEKLAQLQPKNKTVRFNLAVLYYEAKNWPKATGAFESVMAIDPKDVEARKYLLDLYRKQKDQGSELNMLQSLARAEPNNTSHCDAIYAAYRQKKDYKGLVSFFRDLSAKRPDSIQLHNYLLFGLLETGDIKGAQSEIEQLIRLQPKDKKLYKKAADLYENSGDNENALKKFEQLLKLDPKDKEAQENYLRLRMITMSKKKPSPPADPD
ncbi:MAG: tetratricopeptide repeat protein [Syntrophobacteraceae bacterium]